jgi:hypothetical protein
MRSRGAGSDLALAAAVSMGQLASRCARRKRWEHGEPRLEERIPGGRLSAGQLRDLNDLWRSDHWYGAQDLHDLEEEVLLA